MQFHILLVFLAFGLNSVGSHKLTETEVLEYVSSEKLYKDLPYYLSGYDYDGAPIWASEFGKWDLRKYVDGDEKMQNEVDIYADKLLLTMRESARNSTGKQFNALCDLDGWDIRQAASFQTVQFILSKFTALEKIFRGGYLKKGWIVNSNYLFERVWQIGKPLLGNLANQIEFYGSNKDAWKPKILKDLPKDQIPTWYGGSNDYRPVKIYG